MAGQTNTIVFASRQTGIPACGVVNLKTTWGDIRAEYVSGSEIENEDSNWEYDFWVQDEDLPGGVTLGDVITANIVAPLWSCKAEDDAVEEDEDCKARVGACFDSLPVLEELEEGDYVGIFRFDPVCGTYCLYIMTPADLKAELDLLA